MTEGRGTLVRGSSGISVLPSGGPGGGSAAISPSFSILRRSSVMTRSCCSCRAMELDWMRLARSHISCWA